MVLVFFVLSYTVSAEGTPKFFRNTYPEHALEYVSRLMRY